MAPFRNRRKHFDSSRRGKLFDIPRRGKLFDIPRRKKYRKRNTMERFVDYTEVGWKLEDFFDLAEDGPYQVGPPFFFSQCLWELSLLRKHSINPNRSYDENHSFDCHTAFDLHIALIDGDEPSLTVNIATGLLKVNDRIKPLQRTECIFENTKDTYDNYENPVKGLRPSAKIGEIRVMDVYRQRYQLAAHGLIRIKVFLQRRSFDWVLPAAFRSSSKSLTESQDLATELGILFEDPWFPDAIVKVGEYEFKVNKCMLCARSSFFRAMFSHDMIESQTCLINITDCTPYIFKMFLTYLYCGHIDDLSPRSAVQLFIIADKYAIEKLKKMLIHFLIENLDFENVFEALIIADRFEVRELFAAIWRFCSLNWNRIEKTEEWKEFYNSYKPIAKELLGKLLSRGIRI